MYLVFVILLSLKLQIFYLPFHYHYELQKKKYSGSSTFQRYHRDAQKEAAAFNQGCSLGTRHSVATLDLSFHPTARSISTYFYLRKSASILPIIPYIFKNMPTFSLTCFIVTKANIF